MLEAIALVALMYGLILVLQSWSTLPPSIPTHFNAKGEVDGWGSKNMIWLLPAISVVMIPLMLLLRRYPWLSNVPWEITKENAMQQYGLIVRLLSILACVVSFLFLILLYDTISIAGGGTSLLGWWFMPLFIGGTIVPIIWFLIVGFRTR